MIVFAAVDLQQGEVVQLVGGRPENARVRWNDPVGVAQRWEAAGFRALHVIDLDAARGTGSNLDAVTRIIGSVSLPVQVGGGVRESERARDLFTAGAARVITGTRALEDAAWLREISSEFPNRVVVAADVRGDVVLTRGWTEETAQRLPNVLAQLNELPLAAVLITDVGREGQLTGIDATLFQRAVKTSRHAVFAAGGVAQREDLVVLREIGAAGAVLGMSLYTGAIRSSELAGEFL